MLFRAWVTYVYLNAVKYIPPGSNDLQKITC